MIELLMIVDHAVGNSGPHRNVVGTLNALSRRSDIRVTLLTGRIDPSEPYARSSTISVIQPFGCKSPWKIASQVYRVLMLARRSNLIYVPTGLVSSMYAFVARLCLGKKVILGPNVTRLPIRAADSPGYVELTLMADLWLEASRARQRHVLKCVGDRLGGKVKRAQHAIDLEMFRPGRRTSGFWNRYHLSHETLKVLYVGRDERRKGLVEIMGAVGELNKRHLSHTDYVLVGHMSDETRRLAARHPNVHLLGVKHGEELATIYANADIGVVASSWENMPFAVLESLASGLPVVASDVGGIPELVENGICGLLVTMTEHGEYVPDAAKRLARALESLVVDRALRRELGRGARVKAERDLKEERLGNDLMRLFRLVVVCA
jgi:glycosyltransferase involved in cell wall biosynthesis